MENASHAKRFMNYRPVFIAALCLVCGIVLRKYVPLPTAVCLAVLAVSLITTCLLFILHSPAAKWSVFFAVFAAGAFLLSLSYAMDRAGISVDLSDTAAGAFIDDLRTAITNLIYKLYPDTTAGLVSAIVVGDRTGVAPYITEAFRATGIAHILAISGLHVGVIAAGLRFVLARLRASAVLQYIIITLFLVFYSALTNFTASILRASIMFSLMLLATATDERFDNLSVLSFAFVAILLIRPAELFEAGFQLSFAAIFGLYTLSDAIARLWRRPRMLASPISSTVGASLGTSPIFAARFGTFCPLQFVTNLVAIPAASVVVICAVLSVFFGSIYYYAGLPFSFAAALIIRVMVDVCVALSRLPFAEIIVYGFNTVCALISLLILLICSKYCLFSTKQKGLAIGILTAALLICWLLL